MNRERGRYLYLSIPVQRIVHLNIGIIRPHLWERNKDHSCVQFMSTSYCIWLKTSDLQLLWSKYSSTNVHLTQNYSWIQFHSSSLYETGWCLDPCSFRNIDLLVLRFKYNMIVYATGYGNKDSLPFPSERSTVSRHKNCAVRFLQKYW